MSEASLEGSAGGASAIRLLIGLEDDLAAEHLLSYAEGLGATAPVEVRVVHVVERYGLSPGTVFEDATVATEVVERAVFRLRMAGLGASGVVRYANIAQIAAVLLEEAEQIDADVIVLSAARTRHLLDLPGRDVRRKVERSSARPIALVAAPRRKGSRAVLRHRHSPVKDAAAPLVLRAGASGPGDRGGSSRQRAGASVAGGTPMLAESSVAELERSDAGRGRLRVYLGAAAGVGKTHAMLEEGLLRHERGDDVVIGLVESHGRSAIDELASHLEAVPRRIVDYRGTSLSDLDVDAVLRRRPEVVLVDELAHTNVPGSAHEKRWQDVFQLLDAGIEVVTTLNVQHIESIAGAVEQMTGVQVRERVPDWVVRGADQVELVDLSPEQLRARLLAGHVYPIAQVEPALGNFFRPDNLIALRELALRFLADESEDQLLEYLRAHQTSVIWETSERILVGVVAAEGMEAILRRAARMAARTKGSLEAVHVASHEPSSSEEAILHRLRRLASDVGASWVELVGDQPAETLMEHARSTQVTQIVLGSSQRPRWRELIGGGSTVRKVQRMAGVAGIDVHTIARRSLPRDLEASRFADES